MASKAYNYRWPWWMFALWGYSVLFTLLVLFVVFAQTINPQQMQSAEKSGSPVGGLIAFVPVVLFIILVGVEKIRDK